MMYQGLIIVTTVSGSLIKTEIEGNDYADVFEECRKIATGRFDMNECDQAQINVTKVFK